MIKAVIFDLDGTLTDMTHRLKYAKDKEWEVFHSKCGDDLPKKDVIELLKLFADSGYVIFIITGRNGGVRAQTISWLNRNKILFHGLLMREEDDKRHSCVIKEEIYKQYIYGRFDVKFAIDDREDSANMWRMNDITCLQIKSEWKNL